MCSDSRIFLSLKLIKFTHIVLLGRTWNLMIEIQLNAPYFPLLNPLCGNREFVIRLSITTAQNAVSKLYCCCMLWQYLCNFIFTLKPFDSFCGLLAVVEDNFILIFGKNCCKKKFVSMTNGLIFWSYCCWSTHRKINITIRFCWRNFCPSPAFVSYWIPL